MLTFPKITEECLSATRSINGFMRRHGLHQGAQKSTNNFLVDLRILSKFSVVNSITFGNEGWGSFHMQLKLEVEYESQRHQFFFLNDFHSMVSRSLDCSFLFVSSRIKFFSKYLCCQFQNILFFGNFALEF